MSAANPIILYAEDEPDDVFFMQVAFRRSGLAHILRVVENGDQAIAYLSGKPPFQDRDANPLPAIILLDVNLPLRSGFDVLEWLRGQDDLRNVTVVMFSSSGRPEDRSRANALGANDYILKPTSGVSFTDVARQLKQRWLGPHEPSASESVPS